MEHKTLEQYESEIREWDWKKIKQDAITEAKHSVDTDTDERTDDGELIGYSFLGTVFDLAPSGKYYMPWTSNQTDEDIDEDAKFYEALDDVAEANGMYIENGEDDPCDLFACMIIEGGKFMTLKPHFYNIYKCSLWQVLGVTECNNCEKNKECWGDDYCVTDCDCCPSPCNTEEA